MDYQDILAGVLTGFGSAAAVYGLLSILWPRLRTQCLGGRWRCQCCDHAASSHMTANGDVTSCAESILISQCSCQVYVGKLPPQHLIHAQKPSDN